MREEKKYLNKSIELKKGGREKNYIIKKKVEKGSEEQ